MSTTNQRPSSKERFWRRVLRHWRRSGLSVRAFCATQGLSEPSFYAWRRTLGQRDADPVRFVPVQVVPDATPSAASDDGGSSLELVLAGGRRVRIGPGFHGPTLQRLLALLEEGRP